MSLIVGHIKKLHWTAYLSFVTILGCNQLSDYSTNSLITSKKEEDIIVCSPRNGLLETGKSDGKIGHPKKSPLWNELHVIVDGFKIIPNPGLRSWASFTYQPDSAIVTGDIITTEKNFASVKKEVTGQGMNIRDVHEYPARDGSIVLFMHINGFGSHSKLSRSVKALSARLKNLTGQNSNDGKPNSANTNLDRTLLDSIVGHNGEGAEDIYKYTISRPDVLRARGLPENTFAEFKTWAAWQGTDDVAIVAGDFTMLENEVGPVIKSLAENGIELIHNQLVHTNPDIFCLHYWGVGNAEKLATGLKAALDQQEKR